MLVHVKLGTNKVLVESTFEKLRIKQKMHPCRIQKLLENDSPRAGTISNWLNG